MTHFPTPEAPARPMVVLKEHRHDLVLAGADQMPNGVWRSRWVCAVCTDHFGGEPIGPIPAGYCRRCHWVTKVVDAKACEECGASLHRAP